MRPRLRAVLEGAVLAAALTVLAVSVTACGSGGAPATQEPQNSIIPHWTVILTPSGTGGDVDWACFKGNGLYVSETGSESVTVVPADPACK